MAHRSKSLPRREGFIPCRVGPVPWIDLDDTSSTMDEAKSLASGGCIGWTVVSAKTQRTGRGTRGRDWSSPAEQGLWVSIIMPPPSDPALLDGLALRAAGSLVEALHDLTGVRFGIKEPNDVTARGKKLAGILVESVTGGEGVDSVVLGMGVNIGQGAEELAAASLPDATSLRIETGRVFPRERIIEVFLNRFMPLYESLTAGHRIPGV
jgi:BirA family transcriptional regulator, biotin operon repressor / biotin---[acetyl-CoA-carboxylase] ligase